MFSLALGARICFSGLAQLNPLCSEAVSANGHFPAGFPPSSQSQYHQHVVNRLQIVRIKILVLPPSQSL
jgi:hypothetical protein